MKGAEQSTQGLTHIAAEHRGLERRATQLIQLVRRPIEDGALPTALAELTTNLRDLRDLLRRHIAQEMTGGYLEEAVARVPRLARDADAIERQHPDLLRDAAALVNIAKNSTPSLDAWKRLGDAVALTPVVWRSAHGVYPGAEADDKIWYLNIAASHDTRTGPQFHADQVILGLVGAKTSDWIADAIGVVLEVRRPGDITYEQAKEKRAQIMSRLKERFAEVHTFDSELECAKFCAARWPGKKVEGMLAAVAAESRPVARTMATQP